MLEICAGGVGCRRTSRLWFRTAQTIYYRSVLFQEKLCLLVMSMPAHILLLEPMVEAIVFVLEKILDSPPEMLHCWLIGRKMDKISSIHKHSLYPH